MENIFEWDEKQCERCEQIFNDSEINEYNLCTDCQEMVDKDNAEMQSTYDSLLLL
jgi:rRNA maturation endonuclease Nob1